MGSRYMANKIGDKIEPCNGESSLVDIAFKPFKDSIFICVYVCVCVCICVCVCVYV